MDDLVVMDNLDILFLMDEFDLSVVGEFGVRRYLVFL